MSSSTPTSGPASPTPPRTSPTARWSPSGAGCPPGCRWRWFVSSSGRAAADCTSSAPRTASTSTCSWPPVQSRSARRATSGSSRTSVSLRPTAGRRRPAAVEVRESCCATILTQLRAAEMGLPFLPVRGVKGTDLRRLHPEYAENDLPVHRRGARRRAAADAPTWPCCTPRWATSTATSTSSSRTCSTSGSPQRPALVVATRRPARPHRRRSPQAGVTIPAHRVVAVVEAPFGAHPTSCYPRLRLRPAASGRLRGGRGTVTPPRTSTDYVPRVRTPTVLPRRRGRLTAGGVGEARLAGAVPVRPGSDETGRSCSARDDPRRVVRRRPGPHDPGPGGGLPRLRAAPAPRSRCTSPGAPTPPTSLLVEGATYAVNPDPVVHPPDQQRRSPAAASAVYRMRFEEFFDAACRGDVDRMFLSGGQIDALRQHQRHGHRAAGPRPRSSSAAGEAAATSRRRSARSPCGRHGTARGRTLVETCDFVTDFGHRTPAGSRAELGYTGGGPQWLVTELGVFDYDARAGPACARSSPTSPWKTSSAPRGSPVEVSPDLSAVPPPSSVELAVVRSIDPLGVRRSEFDPREIERTFELVHGAS